MGIARWLAALLLALAPCAAGCAQDAVAPDEQPLPPSFVLFLADDQAWSGTSVRMDGESPASASDFYATPHLERLAARGMRFTQAYAPAPNCSPSRLSILTGKSPARLRMTDIHGRGVPGHRNYTGNRLNPPFSIDGIPRGELTLAEALAAHDDRYATAHFGKWHLGGGGPGAHGFDAHDGDTGNQDGNSDDADDPKQVFGISRSAVAFLREQTEAGRPFFLELSHYAVHVRLQSRAETRRACRQRDTGERHSHIGYAAVTQDLDAGLGIVLDELERLGIADRTYVFYVSDNGAPEHKDFTTNAPLRGGKETLFEGGIRVPFVVAGPGIAAGSIDRRPVSGQDLFATILSLAGSRAALPEGVVSGDLGPVLAGEGGIRGRGDELLWHFPHYYHPSRSKPQSAIRAGDYKLVHDYESATSRLFRLSTDLRETVDLAAAEPEQARELEQRLFRRLREQGAELPVRNEEYDPATDPLLGPPTDDDE